MRFEIFGGQFTVCALRFPPETFRRLEQNQAFRIFYRSFGTLTIVAKRRARGKYCTYFEHVTCSIVAAGIDPAAQVCPHPFSHPQQQGTIQL